MFSLIIFFVVAVPVLLGTYLLFAPKAVLRKEAVRLPKLFIGTLEPDSKKERLVFAFWRFCGGVVLLFGVFAICIASFANHHSGH